MLLCNLEDAWDGDTHSGLRDRAGQSRKIGRRDKMGIERCGQRCGHDHSHLPGYLGNRMLMNFPLSLRFGIKAVWRINEGNFSACELRIS